MYQHTKNEVSMSSGSKVIAQIDRQTDRHRHRHTHTHTHTQRHDENITSTAHAGGNNEVTDENIIERTKMVNNRN